MLGAGLVALLCNFTINSHAKHWVISPFAFFFLNHVNRGSSLSVFLKQQNIGILLSPSRFG